MIKLAEMKGFVFAVVFIMIFGTVVATIPTGFLGAGSTATEITTVNPNLLTDFAESANWTGETGDFGGVTGTYYTYEVGTTTFECIFITDSFYVARHDLFFGLWLGGYSYVNFINEDGTNYGDSVSFTDIDNDAVDGSVRYSMVYDSDGTSAGGFVIGWNETTYSGSEDAWDNDELYFVHGTGITADTNIASLLIQILFLQVPNVPILLQLVLVSPVWACILYLLWFIIISMIPFLGGA